MAGLGSFLADMAGGPEICEIFNSSLTGFDLHSMTGNRGIFGNASSLAPLGLAPGKISWALRIVPRPRNKYSRSLEYAQEPVSSWKTSSNAATDISDLDSEILLVFLDRFPLRQLAALSQAQASAKSRKKRQVARQAPNKR